MVIYGVILKNWDVQQNTHILAATHFRILNFVPHKKISREYTNIVTFI